MSDDIIPLLKVHEYFQGVSDEALNEVVRHAQVTHHPTGAVVHEANVLLTTVGFVLRGRLKAVRIDARGTESFFRMIGRGEQFGFMIGAISEPVPIRVVAAGTHDGAYCLEYEQAMELTFEVSGRAAPVADDLCREPSEALLWRRPEAVADDARADSRFTCHAPGGGTAHRPVARCG